jgi:hypothetical protein
LFLEATGINAMKFSIPRYDAKTLYEIRSYLVRYSIGTVVVDLTEPGAPLVVPYLKGVLGQPQSVGYSDVWFDVQLILANAPVVGSGSVDPGTASSRPAGT